MRTVRVRAEGAAVGAPRVPRRALLRTVALSAGAWAAGTAAAGCSRHAPVAASPAPTAAGAPIRLTIQLNWQGASGGNFTGSAVQQLADAFLRDKWLPRHPGVTFTTLLGGGSHITPTLDNGPTVSALLAGNGPDILEVCCSGIPALEDTGLLLPLDPLVRQDNLDLGIFPQGVMSGLTTDQGLLGLPNAGQTEPLFVNLSLLDELGLPYPDPEWDYQEATRLWTAVARARQDKPLYGACLNYASTMMQWLVAGFGGQVYDRDHTTCLLDQPACLRAFAWLVPLLQDKIVVPRQTLGPIPGMAAGQVAFASACCGALGQAVVTFGTSFKWDLIPMPAFPVAKANGVFHALYGINAESRAPRDLLWDLLKFLCVEPDWQLFWNAQLALASPNQITPSLWEQWEAIVRAVAPLTRTKHLEYFAQAAQYGQGWAFAKHSAAQAAALEQQAYNQMLARTESVEAALRQAAAQITALERVAAQEMQAGKEQATRFPTRGRDVAQVPTGI